MLLFDDLEKRLSTSKNVSSYVASTMFASTLCFVILSLGIEPCVVKTCNLDAVSDRKLMW